MRKERENLVEGVFILSGGDDVNGEKREKPGVAGY